MPASLATDATLLLRHDSGEKGQLLTFLSPSHGLLRAFKRTSTSRTGRQPNPDLFDDVSVTLDHAPTGDLYFVREYIVRHRRTGIGERYPSLLYASRFALILSHHLFPVEEADQWHALLRQSLDAWETHNRPECAYFKSLYLFARQQGYPVKEEWIATLRPDHRETATTILRLPLANQLTAPPLVETLITAFEHHLHHHHEIRIR